MEHLINIGLIVCGNNLKHFTIDWVGVLNGYRVKKVFTTDNMNRKTAHEYYPLAELVDDALSIITDSSIPLVVLTNSDNNRDLDIVALALKCGKQVRTI